MQRDNEKAQKTISKEVYCNLKQFTLIVVPLSEALCQYQV